MGPWSPLALAEAVEAVLQDVAAGHLFLVGTRRWGSSKDAEGQYDRKANCRVGYMEERKGIVNSEMGER